MKLCDKHEHWACVINVKLHCCLKGSSVVCSSFSQLLASECCLHLFLAFPQRSSGSRAGLVLSLQSAQLLLWLWGTAGRFTTILFMHCCLTSHFIKAQALQLIQDRLCNKVLWFFYLVLVWKALKERWNYVWIPIRNSIAKSNHELTVKNLPFSEGRKKWRRKRVRHLRQIENMPFFSFTKWFQFIHRGFLIILLVLVFLLCVHISFNVNFLWV